LFIGIIVCFIVNIFLKNIIKETMVVGSS